MDSGAIDFADDAATPLFELPDEIRMLKEHLRRFVDKELIPIEHSTCEHGMLKPEALKSLTEKAKPLGLDGYNVPTEYGGQGLPLLAQMVILSELGRTIALPCRGADVILSGPLMNPILFGLDDEQKEKFLYPTLRREIRWCFCQTEPDAGGDPGSMRTTAVRDGDDYIINGTKRFITHAELATYAFVVAATDREKGSSGGISVFMVDMKSPGVTLLRQQELIIDDRPWEIAFDNVRVPVRNRIGEEGDGFKHAQGWLSVGRLRHAARSIGVIERCLELASAYAKQRVTFGQPLASRQAVQWMLADAFVDLHQLRLMVYHACAKHDRGEDIRVEAYMAKMFGDTRSYLAADNAMQIHGGMGLTSDLPMQKFWRDQRSMVITEGPTEVLKMAIARHVLRTFA
jgi:acyl-CoA dehydrogenase